MCKTFWFLTLFVAAFMLPAHAREAQTCDDKTIEAVAAWAEVKGKLVSADEEPDGLIVAAACKAMPNAPGTTIAAIAFETDREVYNNGQSEMRIILQAITLVEAGKVVAAHRSYISENSPFNTFNSNSYRIDTARYVLSRNVRAFGVIFRTAGAFTGCYDAGFSDELSLWIREGRNLRAVFGTVLHSWRNFYKDSSPGEWLSEGADITISVENTSSHGFADLAITAHVMQEDCRLDSSGVARCGGGGEECSYTGKRTVRKVVKYNGQSYGDFVMHYYYDETPYDSYWSPSVSTWWWQE